MGWTKALFFVGGMAAAGLAKIASNSKTIRSAAVNATAVVLDANDAIQEATQSLMDDADDVRAEAERQRKIDAAVAERIAKIEEGIREEVIAEVDGKPAKKTTSRSSRSKK
ncbi:MAG: hypothetical protein IJ113_01955 [Eggerthellaceae bacterium]|nr:hypothetical protein [Eggerthellaceae bacterium]